MNRLLFYFLLAFTQQVFSQESLKLDFPVEKYKLENGLTVLLHEDHTVPLISYHTWYKVGSRDESPGVTGAAHMLEHMMFKGAKKYSGKDFDRILHENGITNNAFTTNDYTGFYQNLPSHKLELMMDLEVDRMRSLALRPEDLKSELQVVGEERRWRVDNNPPGRLREVFMDLLYKIHPYRWPVIGTMEDIQAYTSDKLREFYDRYYVPNNAVLVIAGDIDINKTKALVAKYYSSLKPKDLPVRDYPVEPLLTEKRFKAVDSEVQAETFLIGYPGTEVGHPDSYALDLLASMLGGGKSSRFYKKMVYEKQTALSASAFNSGLKNPGSFGIVVAMKPNQNWEPAAQLIQAEIEKVKKEKVSTRELQKVKNQLMKDYVDSLETIDQKAQSLALNEIYFGDYRVLFGDLEKYNHVTTDQVLTVAQKYLSRPSITTLMRPMPQDLPAKKER